MLFNSFDFVFLFIPFVAIGFFALNMVSQRGAVVWLICASLVYYSWWNYGFAPLLISSIIFNYLLGLKLQGRPNRAMLTVGILANLGLLGWYKYAGFFLNILSDLSLTSPVSLNILLPIGISFFTFQQIAWLVDCHRQVAEERGVLRYALFVSFFPQLVAGPIVHFKEIMPQFMRHRSTDEIMNNLALGSSLFFVGLAKKVLLADRFQPFADVYFSYASDGVSGGHWRLRSEF